MYTYLTTKNRVLTFRQFKRKGWALFAALGREVRIGVLAAGTLACAAPRLLATPAHSFPVLEDGVEEAGDTVPLSEATVSASRVPVTAMQAARQVTTLTRTDIAAAGVTAVSDIFKLAASVDVRQRGGFGIQQDISIDGGTFDQAALLINGIPYANVQTGHNAAQFPFCVDDVERVEVVEGAASRLFGGSAFSGAINVVTRKDDSGGGARLQAGSYGTLTASARHALRFGTRWQSSLSASARRSDGAVRNGDFKGGSLFWQGRYEDGSLRLHAQAGHVADDFGANTFYSPANDRQWEATRRTLLSLSALTKGRLALAPSVSWTRSTDHYQWIRGTHDGENFNRTDVLHAAVNAFGTWTLGRTAVGAEVRNERLLSGNLGAPIPESRWVRIPGQGGACYTRSARRTNLDLYAEHTVLLPRWTLSAGLLAQRSSMLGSRLRLFPGVDASWRPAAGLRLFASWNSALRLPTFTELWYRSPSQQGNAGLRPERNTQWRIGGEWQRGAFRVEAKAHLGHGRDMIDWVMYAPDDVYHAAAFRLSTAGLSATAELDALHLLGPRQPLRRVTAAYAYLHQRRKDGARVFRSNYAMNFLRHKLVCTLSHTLPWGVGAQWTLRVDNRAGAYPEYEGAKPTGRLRGYGTHALLDLKLQRRAGRFALTCELQNLTCRRYVDIAGVPQPGLLVLAGAQVRW